MEWAWEELMEWVEFQAWPWLLEDGPSDHRRVRAPPHQSPLPLPSTRGGRERGTTCNSRSMRLAKKLDYCQHKI